jgi:cell division GTPase FtsZ
LKPKIVLVGIGGGGGSTINNMIKRKLTGEWKNECVFSVYLVVCV